MKLSLAAAACVLLVFTAGWWIGRTTTLDIDLGARLGRLESAVDTDVGARLGRLESALEDLHAQVGELAAGLPAAGPQGPDPAKVYEIETGASPARGPAGAAVTIVEFADFECPFCASAEPTLASILAAFPGQVRLVFKHNPLPIHRQALPAHKAAIAAAAQGKFWEMHKLLFESQEKLGPEKLKEHARALELDLEAFATSMESAAVLKCIQADQVLAGRYGIMGVPSFFINGRFLAGVQPYEVFRERIEEELRKK